MNKITSKININSINKNKTRNLNEIWMGLKNNLNKIIPFSLAF